MPVWLESRDAGSPLLVWDGGIPRPPFRRPRPAASLRSLRAALENASRFLSSAPLRVRIPPFAHKKAPWADESSGRSVTLAGTEGFEPPTAGTKNRSSTVELRPNVWCCPKAIVSIDQKTTSKNPRSTVGTVTEIYDYLRLLFARVGTPHCPECGRVIERQTTDQVADKVLAAGEGRRAFVLAPVVRGRKGEYTKLFEDLRAEGFSRVRVDGEVRSLDDPIDLDKKFKHDIEVVVDRIVIRENSLGRIAESVEQATALAHGNVNVYMLPDRDAPEGTEGELLEYSLALACPEHGHSIDDLQPRDFSFNAPYGACPECDGLGFKKTVDAEALIEDPSKSIADGVFGSLFGNSNYYPQIFAAVCKHFKVSVDTPWEDLPPRVRRAFLDGMGDQKISVDYQKLDGRRSQWDTKFSGVRNILYERYTETTNENTKTRLEKYIREEPCSSCHGARLRPEMLAVTVGGKSIYEVCCLSCRESLEFFEDLELTERQQFIGGRIVKEILERLRFLVDVGLDYLTLDRASATLSGGEAQRIRLATQIGAGLMGVLYILDEPSIGLHQRDNERLIKTLERLRDIGNTVIVVEHDEDTIRAADYVIDMKPRRGRERRTRGRRGNACRYHGVPRFDDGCLPDRQANDSGSR